MKYQIFSDNEWLYPDSKITEQNRAVLYAARGSDVCFQILTDYNFKGDEDITFSFDCDGCDAVVYQLLTAHVTENSDAKFCTTKDYDSVKHFVTRKAPFDVYEITRPLDSGKPEAVRAAFYVRINVAFDANVGTRDTSISISFGGETITIPVSLKVYSVQVPPLEKSEFHMVNWIIYKSLAKQHNVEFCTKEYGNILSEYLKNEIDMRTDYLMIPRGEPIYDDQGVVIDFDFTHAEFVGNMAIQHGFKYIMGGFVARFEEWDQPDHFLLWDRKIGVTSVEGYRQLKIYFNAVRKCVERNGWGEHYMQCLVDEPQFPNSLAYRALSGICRKHIPGIVIHDPVETTDIAGALDIWVVKQAIYEKYLETYQKLQAMGEEMWIYTCGFPTGKTMNRVIDLPLTVSRLPMWMCYKYNCPGFLHWGYNEHNSNIREDTNFHPDDIYTYPAGNSFVVYPGDNRPWYSVRGHLQRAGAYDYELLNILGKKDKAKALAIIDKICRTFDDYDPSPRLFDEVRHELLEELG